MPRAARFRTACIARLWEGTRYADRRARMRMAADAEAFGATVEPSVRYPEELVVERITRYRPERAAVGPAVTGSELLGDLSALVLRLTRRDPLGADERGGAMALDEAAQALGVTRRTMERFRAAGLVLHHVRGDDGHVRVACFADALAAFRVRAGARMERAARTVRLAPEAREAMCAAAAAACIGLRRPSLQSLAVRASRASGCSVRTARTVLAGDARVGAAIAAACDAGTAARGTAGPGRPRRRSAAALAARAMALGASPARIGEWLGCTPTRAMRAALRGRSDALRSLEGAIGASPLPVFALPGAANSILGPAVVRSGLCIGVPEAAVRPGAAARGTGAGADAALLVAVRFLRWRAAAGVRALAPVPSLAEFDGVERDLRWAHRAWRTLLVRVLPAALRPCEQRLGRAWDQVPAPLRARWASFAAAESARALDAVDLVHAGVDTVRPAQVAMHGVELAIARGGPEFAPPFGDGPDAVEQVLARSVPWWAAVCGGDGWSAWAAALPAEPARVAMLRLGLDGTPPRTFAELARELRTSTSRATAAWYAARAAPRFPG